MAYIGNSYTEAATTPYTDFFNGDGVTVTFTLTRDVLSINDIDVYVNNVPQHPTLAYGISGSNKITFTSPPSVGTSNVYVRYIGKTLSRVALGQGTVGTAQLGSISNINSIGSNLTLQTNSTNAVTIDQSLNSTFAGNITVGTVYGKQYSTNGANIDLTEYTDGNFTVLEVVGSANPNAGGSGSYADPIHMYVYKGTGYNGSAVTDYIYSASIAPRAREIYPSGSGASANIINAVWVNGGTESDTVPVATTTAYVRLKVVNYNTTFGSGFSVRVKRLA